MQLSNVKISNLSTYPRVPDLNKIEGIRFSNKENNNVNVLIGPNGTGKSSGLHIISQIFYVGLIKDYIYDRKLTCLPRIPGVNQPVGKVVNQESKKFKDVISSSELFMDKISKHFRSPDKESEVIVQLHLTDHDYYNINLLCKNTKLINNIIKKYSNLNLIFDNMKPEDIKLVNDKITFHFKFDIPNNKIIIDESGLSVIEKFILNYFRERELIQICIDIYNQWESDNKSKLPWLKNTFAIIWSDRKLRAIANVINPLSRDQLIAEKNTSAYYSIQGYYLCAKKIRNIIQDDIVNYKKNLKKSEFYNSLVSVIQKYFEKSLDVEYDKKNLIFNFVDNRWNKCDFDDFSDGQQSLLVMLFAIYGYDLKDGMLIINEPEIHFHPQMQRSLARMLEKVNENIGTQFIISTYSPLFINEKNISNVYRFAKIDGETELKNPAVNIDPDEASLVHILKLENLSKIFFVNKIIMVEWETDQYFFEFYLKHLHINADFWKRITDYEIININGKWSYKIWAKFLSKFGIKSYFVWDRDNIVDYGILNQVDLNYYYKQVRKYFNSIKKNKTGLGNHYSKLVATIKNLFPDKYEFILNNIDRFYNENIFILKKWDIESYLGIKDKWLDSTISFCHHDFKQWLSSKNLKENREEFQEIFRKIFT